MLHQQFPRATTFDLLDSTLRTELTLRPALLRERVSAAPRGLVIIDEIQKVPALLDEVHLLLESTPARFILCGSSARKLRHGAANLLGGRAWRFELFPLTTALASSGRSPACASCSPVRRSSAAPSSTS